MNQLEDQIRAYAEASVDDAIPVTAEEARERAGRRRKPLTTWLAIAAVLIVLLGLAGSLLVDRGDGDVSIATGLDFPMTLDGHRDFQVAVLNGDKLTSDDDVRARFSDDFLRAVSPEEFRQTVESVRQLGPWTVLDEVERRGDVLVVQLEGRSDNQARLTLMIGEGNKVIASTILMAEPCAAAVSADEPLEPALGDQFAWVEDLLSSQREPAPDELRERFAPSFLAEIPPERLKSAVAQLRGLGPYTYRHHEGPPLETSLTMRVGVRTGEEARLTLSVEPDPPHRITAFAIFTQQPCRLSKAP